jgi:hypothetical protein
MSSRRLTRSYAVANLEGMQLPIAVPAKHRKQSHNSNNNEDVLATPEGPEPGQPGESSGQPGESHCKTADPTVRDSEDVAKGVNEMTMRKPTVVNRKVVPPRSPLPSRAKRPLHPGAPDMAKPKRTSAEVTAAAERRAILQRQADELEQRKIDTLADSAEMELDEELAEEEEERTTVRMQAHADSLDDTEDVIMQFEDEDGKGTSTEEIFELSTSEEDAQPRTVKGKNVVPKKTQVSFFF